MPPDGKDEKQEVWGGVKCFFGFVAYPGEYAKKWQL